MDDLRLPFTALRGYVEKLEAGEEIERPLERIVEERARITDEYARAASRTDEDREAFLELVSLARQVYPYVENHNFYVEHWHHSIFWNKVRELGDVFVAHGFFADREDIFYLHRHEIHAALYDLRRRLGDGLPGARPELLAARSSSAARGILEALRTCAARAGARHAARAHHRPDRR